MKITTRNFILILNMVFLFWANTAFSRTGYGLGMDGDVDSDGKVDVRRTFGPDGDVISEEVDEDFDGVFETYKSYSDSMLVMTQKDTNKDGKVDTWEYYKKGKLDRVEFDSDGDGNADKITFSNKLIKTSAEKKLTKKHRRTNNYYKTLTEKIINLSPNVFNKISQWIFKEHSQKAVKVPPEPNPMFNKTVTAVFTEEGSLVKVGVARKGVMWKGFLFHDGKLKKVVCDPNGDGKLNEFSYYNNDGVLVKEELDLNYDGRVNSWRYLNNGVITRGEYDSNFDGFVDQWNGFENGIIIKSFYDTNHDTKKDKFFYYSNRHLDRMEQDHNHDGKIDHWSQYDDFGHKTKSKRDINFDGIIDRWEVYKNNHIITIYLDTDMDGQPDKEIKK